MDGNRFDSFARLFAKWTTRRQFFGGMAGAAVGSYITTRQVRAQEEEENVSTELPVDLPDDGTFDDPADQEVLTSIVDGSTIAHEQLVRYWEEVNAYRAWGQTNVGANFEPYHFDNRFGWFVDDLIILTERGMQASSWTNRQLRDYLLTIHLVGVATSAGGDTDFLYQHVLSVFAEQGIEGDGTPSASGSCISSDPPENCSASCLDVWTVRQAQDLAKGDMLKLLEHFFYFIECYVWKGSLTADVECLSSLIDQSCARKVSCGCSGDCR